MWGVDTNKFTGCALLTLIPKLFAGVCGILGFSPWGRSVVFNWAFISCFAFLFITLFHYCPSLLALSCCFLLPLILLPFITHLHVDVRQYPVHITCSPLSCFYYFILLWAQYMCSHILLVLATHSHTSHAAKKLQNLMLWMYRGLGSMHLMISCCSLAINVPSSHGDGVWNVYFVYVAIQKKIWSVSCDEING